MTETMMCNIGLKDKILGGLTRAKTICSILVGFTAVGLSPISVLAGDSSTEKSSQNSDVGEFDFLKEGADDNGAFDKATKAIQETGRSGVKLLQAVGAISLIVAIITVGICFMLKKGSKLEEGKERIVNIVIGGACVFGVFGIAAMIAGFGKSFG